MALIIRLGPLVKRQMPNTYNKFKQIRQHTEDLPKLAETDSNRQQVTSLGPKQTIFGCGSLWRTHGFTSGWLANKIQATENHVNRLTIGINRLNNGNLSVNECYQ